MKSVLHQRFGYQSLSRQEAREVIMAIAQGQYHEAQMAAFMASYKMHDITLPEIQGFADALLELRIPVDLGDLDTIDVVGTGGDGKNTFNISTLSSFVLAGAGYHVAKHGNYGVSSACGSSNVLEFLGYKFTNDVDALRRQLDRHRICFFHAPLFHPALKTVGPIRRGMAVSTFFNMLGPLVNPAQPARQLTGVYDRQLARLYQYYFQQTNRSYTIIHALDGYDEVSLTGPFLVKSNLTEQVLQPEDVGLTRINPVEIFGGNTVESAAKIFVDILEGRGTSAQMDVVAANAGLGIHCFKQDQPITSCIQEAREALVSGQALSTFKQLINAQ